MRDRIFSPSDLLTPYVKYYWTCRHDEDVQEVMYPSGSVEFCIDISTGNTVRHRGERSMKVPNLEVIGHWNVPTQATITKGNTCLITRFHPYASSLFFPHPPTEFTNESIDLYDMLSQESIEFYDRLMTQRSLDQKVKVLDAFLIQRLTRSNKNHHQLKLVECLCNHIYHAGESFSMQTMAENFGFSERHIQKLFLTWVGITPKSFFSVQRFNKSLELVRSSSAPLTSIALECGYYDQAHFIKEFKSYTGLTPTQVTKTRLQQIN